MIHVPLTQGKVALIDEEDADIILPYKWYARRKRSTFYACRTMRQASEGGRQVSVLMHRAILHPPSDSLVDHRDGNGLDNRRTNLRLASLIENNRNRGKSRSNTSGYKGVTWRNDCARWQAQISCAGRMVYLGLFDDLASAAAAYDQAARELHGDFAMLNMSEGV